MQEIEKPIREDDARARAAAAQPDEQARESGERHDPAADGGEGRDHAGRGGASRSASVRTARRSSSRLTVAVPRFMTTIPPA